MVVIVGILAAIALPRLSRGSGGASFAALLGDLATMRAGIDKYSAEHNGRFPTEAGFEAEMTGYTTLGGAPSPIPTDKHIFGPYLREIPPLPVGFRTGQRGVAGSSGEGVGWIYDQSTGDIRANTSDDECSDEGKPFNSY